MADGAVAAAGSAGGRLVPVIMVDMSGHPQVAELIRVHEHLGQGDCFSQWATSSRRPNDQIALRLRFTRPADLSIAVVFELPRQAGLVDQVLAARALLLQHGVEGDRMLTTFDNPRLLIELPPTGFEEEWERLFPAVLTRMFRESGIGRRDAKASAREMVDRWRQLGSIRM